MNAQIITIMFLTDSTDGTLQPDAEGLELRYFKLSALPDDLFEPNLPILEAIQKRFGKNSVRNVQQKS